MVKAASKTRNHQLRMSFFGRVMGFRLCVIMNVAWMAKATMEPESKTINHDKIKKFIESLEDARIYERDRMIWGVNRVYRHFENVDGDWLEKWGEEDEEESVKDAEGSLAKQEFKPQ